MSSPLQRVLGRLSMGTAITVVLVLWSIQMAPAEDLPLAPGDVLSLVSTPGDLSGVALDRPAQTPLLARLRGADAELVLQRTALENADRQEAAQRGDATRAGITAGALGERITTLQARQDELGAQLAALGEPRRQATRSWAAAAVDAYVAGDLEGPFHSGSQYDQRRTRRQYTDITIEEAFRIHQGLETEGTTLMKQRGDLGDATASARAERNKLLLEEAAATRAAADAAARLSNAERRVKELTLETQALWAGIVTIGREPVSSPTSIAGTGATNSVSTPATVNPGDVVRLTNAALSAPLGPVATYLDFDFPAVVLDAYVLAAERMARDRPACHMRWQLLAAIGRVESYHGRVFGNSVDAAGNVRPGIRGPALDGVSFALILDTDGGRYDGDTTYDRAVGPMQFIPGSWRIYGRDGDGNGTNDPHNYYDATVAAAEHLCRAGNDTATGDGLFRAIFGYNASSSYVATVLGYMAGYARFNLPSSYGAKAPSQTGPLPPIRFPNDPTTVSTTSTTKPTSTTVSPSTTLTSTTSSTTSTTSSSTTSSSTTTSSTTTSSTAGTTTSTAAAGSSKN